MLLKRLVPVCTLVFIVLLFFYKTVLLGKIPFAGDLLLSQYAPWRHVSYFGYVAGAVPSKDQYFDVVRELYPWKTEGIRQIKESTIPLWNPYNFSGTPLLSNFQSQVFYPLGLIYIVFPQITAWTILVILQPLLGSIFMYLFATIIGISPAGAVLTAVAFNFCSFSNTWIEFNTVWHTILWLPFLLYLVEQSIVRKRISILTQILFVFAFFSLLTAGHPQDCLYCILFFYAYLFIRTVFHCKNGMYFLLLSFISFLLAAPQLLPTIELYKNSARVPHDFSFTVHHMLFQWWQTGLIVVQDFFGNPATKTSFLPDSYVGKVASIGSAGFLIALFALRDWKNQRSVRFFAVASGIILLLTINSPLSRLLYIHPIPILSTGSPSRILFLFCFSLAILAGFGFDQIRNKQKMWKVPVIAIGIIFFLLWCIALIHPSFPNVTYTATSFIVMKKAMMMASACIAASLFVIYCGIRWNKKFLYILIIIVCAELLYGFLKFNPFVPKGFVYPDSPLFQYLQTLGGIDRIWGYGTAGVEANFTTQVRLFSPDGTDPLNLRWYNEFLQSGKDGNLARTFTRSTRSDTQLAPGYGELDLPGNPYRLRVMDALGVKYIIDRTENPKTSMTFPNDRFKEIWHKEDWTVYENTLSAPRYFLTDQIQTYNSVEEFEQKFFSPDFNPSKSVLVSDENLQGMDIMSHHNETGNSVRLDSYKADRLQFTVTADSPKLLYISDTFDFGWSAQCDGNPIPVYKANWAFRAVRVPPGEHSIVMTYRPKSFIAGCWVAAVGLSLGILFVFGQCIMKKADNRQKKQRQ